LHIPDLIVKLYVLLVFIGVIPLTTNKLISVLVRTMERANNLNNLNIIFLESVDICNDMLFSLNLNIFPAVRGNTLSKST